ncbi:hypothetical protein [Streptomyces acidiscabies]|uniref:Uncharacterized protein n=1 Tax=Streptomyces acidiscabies TaxID=42234 RepID=A0AAP6EJP9_9ACTN|nr:hypothetical protein [Streptomyces acidiscabies]MBP5942235.1 hypothetical protein [Streptomyces sp. LBUM 1476]MBZ3913764.1 hypothetical protein [Streptomyces acidiscabies]MDX2965239.1 hypothetical protein [Streptomyces acidiscabies]MDX3022145.1 hypothetical protein [Streptomyces acidiscabies]MDX3795408.1 hypothetical protein [Streptomyces acidiscabies]
MASAHHRPGGAHSAALRWTRSAVIALVAALAVLVHHDTAAALTQVPAAGVSATSSMTGMHHAVAPAMPAHTSGHAMARGGTAPIPAHDDDGACSGTAMQHCSAAGVDGLKFAPPHQPCTGCTPAFPPGATAGRDIPGTTGRVPPDLSVLLSRFLL